MDELKRAFSERESEGRIIERIESGADVRAVVDRIIWAVETGRIDIVERFVDAGANLDASPPIGTPLCVACRRGDLKMVKFLVERGADPEGGTFFTPLSRAFELNQQAIAEFLVDLELRLDGAIKFPWLGMAAEKGWVAVAARLLQLGANLEARHNVLGDATAAAKRMGAALLDSFSKSDVVSVTLSDFAPEPTISGGTPLIIAASGGHRELVELLLDAGADLFAVCDDGGMALHYATSLGHGATADVLSARGAPLRLEGSLDEELRLAARDGDAQEVRSLLDQGADVSSVAPFGKLLHQTALNCAVEGGHLEVVRVLLEASANPDGGERYFRLPLHEAARRGSSEILQCLLEAGANPRSVHESADETTISAAVESGDIATLDVLFSHVSVDETDIWGETALFAAVTLENLEVIDYLLDRGANPLVTAREETLLEFASKHFPEEVRTRITRAVKDAKAKGMEPILPPFAAEKAEASERLLKLDVSRYTHKRARNRMEAALTKEARSRLEDTCESSGYTVSPALLWGAMLHVSRRKDADDQAAVATRMRDQGALLLPARGRGFAPEDCLVFPTLDEIDAVATLGVGGGEDLEDFVRFLVDMRERHPFRITKIGGDLLNGLFLSEVGEEAEVLAERNFDMCPDLHSPKKILESIRDRQFYFWWD